MNHESPSFSPGTNIEYCRKFMDVIEEKYTHAFPAFFFEIHEMIQTGNWFKGMQLQVQVENEDAIQRQAVPIYIETRRGTSETIRNAANSGGWRS